MKILNIALLTGLAISTAIGVISLSVATGSTYPIQYPEIPKLRNSTPVCYMETAKGKVIDLSDMCGKASEFPISTPIPTPIPDPTPVPNPTPMQ